MTHFSLIRVLKNKKIEAGTNFPLLSRIWSHLLKKSVMENFIFCAVLVDQTYSLFRFVCFPNSLSSVTKISTKLLKPVLSA